MEFITEHNVILIPLLVAIEYAIRSSKILKPKYIPLALIVLGAFFGAVNGLEVLNVLEGIICAGISMGIYNSPKLIKNN